MEEIRRFVEASEGLQFQGRHRAEVYGWMEQVLVGQQYATQGKAARGLLRRYMEKMTGLSRAQVSRLIGRYMAVGRVPVTEYRRHRFATHYTRADAELLAQVDEAHGTLAGPATRRILEREYRIFAKAEFERLSAISVAHLYNLRKSSRYRERLRTYTRTRPTAVSIGERRRPDPSGQPGFLRVDTVHQGDRPDAKGVYHINAVDEVTQWQVVVATPRIAESFLEPVLEAMLRQFPFRIQGFHSDNGSEFLNKTVARLLEKLRIEQTKSRPRHSNDNGLVETKNECYHPQAHRLWLHRRRRRPAAHRLLSRLPQPLSELPSALRPARCLHRPQGAQTHPLQALSNPARDSARAPHPSPVPAPRTQPKGPPARGPGAQRHRSRHAHATG